MKKILAFIFATVAFASNLSAQIGVGIHGGATISHTDATPDKTGYFVGLNADKSLVDFLGLNFNINLGKLQGGEPNTNTMQYENNYFSTELHLKIFPVAILAQSKKKKYLYYLSKIYGSAGIGLLSSNTKIAKLSNTSDFKYISDYKGADSYFPLGFGIDMPLSKAFSDKGLVLNISYNTNYFFTDKIDGYVPNVSSNLKNDTYSSFGIGITYRFLQNKRGHKTENEVPETPEG